MSTLQEALKTAGASTQVTGDWEVDQGRQMVALMGEGRKSKRESCVALPWRIYFIAKDRGWINDQDEKVLVKTTGMCWMPRSFAEMLLQSFRDLYIPTYNMPESMFRFGKHQGYPKLEVAPEVFNYEDCVTDPEVLLDE